MSVLGSASTQKCSSEDTVFIPHNFWFPVMLGQQRREHLQSSWPFWTHVSQNSRHPPKNTEVGKGEARWVRLGFFSSQFWIFVPQIQLYSNWALFWPYPSHLLKSLELCQLRLKVFAEAAAKSETIEEVSHHQCGATKDSSAPEKDNSPQPHAANYCSLLLDPVIMQPRPASMSFAYRKKLLSDFFFFNAPANSLQPPPRSLALAAGVETAWAHGRGQITSMAGHQFTPSVKPYPKYLFNRSLDTSGVSEGVPVPTVQAYWLARTWASVRSATERCRTGLNEVEKWAGSGRWQGSKALAGVPTAVQQGRNVMRSREPGEEGERRGKTFQLPPTMGRPPKACEPLDVCFALALPGERVDRTERRKERKHQQGNRKQEAGHCISDQLCSTKAIAGRHAPRWLSVVAQSERGHTA